MRVLLQPAFVLHTRPYRDSSQLLEVLTNEYGRISLVAKGARRARKGQSSAGILQPFIPLLLSFSGRAELKTLTASEVAGEVLSLKGQRLFSGIYLNELLVRLLHRNDPHPDLFIAYGQAISSLGGEAALDEVLRRFEFRLLEELGYSFDLVTDGLSGEPVLAQGWYHYQQEFGLVECGAARSPDMPAYCGADLLAIAGGQLDDSARLAAKRLLRQALAGHLGDKPLNSRALFRRTESAGGKRMKGHT